MIFIYFYSTIKSEEILLFQDFSPLFQDFLKLPSFNIFLNKNKTLRFVLFTWRIPTKTTKKPQRSYDLYGYRKSWFCCM